MGNPKQPTRQNVINWVSTAREGTREDVIRDAFLKCGLTAKGVGVLGNQNADDDVESDEEDGNDTVDDFDSFDD